MKPSQGEKVGKYIIEKPLSGPGTLGARVALTSDKGKKRVIKYYPKEGIKSTDDRKIIKSLIENEVKTLKYLKEELKEPNKVIVDEFDHSSADNYYIVLEYLPNGTLLDFINYLHKHNKMTEELAKAIFKNLLDLVNEIHKCNVSHLDLKPENIMFDEKGEMRLIDFGHSRRSGSGVKIIHPGIGTHGVAAPEIPRKNPIRDPVKPLVKDTKRPYIPKPADVFSLGVTLFTLYFFRFPFEICNETNEEYGLIIKEKYEEFWTHWHKKLGPKYLSASKELKLLIIFMILNLPEARLALSEVMNSPWIKSTTQNGYEELNVEIRNLVINSKQ